MNVSYFRALIHPRAIREWTSWILLVDEFDGSESSQSNHNVLLLVALPSDQN